ARASVRNDAATVSTRSAAVSRAGPAAWSSAALTPHLRARLAAELPTERAPWPPDEGPERWPHQTVRQPAVSARGSEPASPPKERPAAPAESQHEGRTRRPRTPRAPATRR